MVKCLAQGHKCHDPDSNQHSAADNTRKWVQRTKPFGHGSPHYDLLCWFNIWQHYSFRKSCTQSTTLQSTSQFSIYSPYSIHYFAVNQSTQYPLTLITDVTIQPQKHFKTILNCWKFIQIYSICPELWPNRGKLFVIFFLHIPHANSCVITEN